MYTYTRSLSRVVVPAKSTWSLIKSSKPRSKLTNNRGQRRVRAAQVCPWCLGLFFLQLRALLLLLQVSFDTRRSGANLSYVSTDLVYMQKRPSK